MGQVAPTDKISRREKILQGEEAWWMRNGFADNLGENPFRLNFLSKRFGNDAL